MREHKRARFTEFLAREAPCAPGSSARRLATRPLTEIPEDVLKMYARRYLNEEG